MKNPHAQALGRLGGLAKARKMTARNREEQADRAAYARVIKAKRAAIAKHLEKDSEP